MSRQSEVLRAARSRRNQRLGAMQFRIGFAPLRTSVGTSLNISGSRAPSSSAWRMPRRIWRSTEPAPFVRGQHAVGDQERRRAQVVGDDTVRGGLRPLGRRARSAMCSMMAPNRLILSWVPAHASSPMPVSIGFGSSTRLPEARGSYRTPGSRSRWNRIVVTGKHPDRGPRGRRKSTRAAWAGASPTARSCRSGRCARSWNGTSSQIEGLIVVETVTSSRSSASGDQVQASRWRL